MPTSVFSDHLADVQEQAVLGEEKIQRLPGLVREAVGETRAERIHCPTSS